MPYLTDKELAALQDSPLSRKTPFVIEEASQGFFSISRHYGGMKYNGATYVYNPITDELIRNDVVKWMHKYRKGVKPKKQENLEIF